MPIIIGLQINIITYHIMLLMELRDEPYRLFQNIDNSNMNDDIMYLLMWITLSMVPMPSRYSEPGMCVSKWPPFGLLIAHT